jgi:hypothetical protein
MVPVVWYLPWLPVLCEVPVVWYLSWLPGIAVQSSPSTSSRLSSMSAPRARAHAWNMASVTE